MLSIPIIVLPSKNLNPNPVNFLLKFVLYHLGKESQYKNRIDDPSGL